MKRTSPARRRAIPAAFMAVGFVVTLAGSFGFTPISDAAEETTGIESSNYDSGPVGSTSTTVPETTSTVAVTTTTINETTTVPETTTTVPETTTTVYDSGSVGSTTTTSTIPSTTTTTTVAKTTTTAPETTTTAAETTTTAPVTTTTIVGQTTTTAAVRVVPATEYRRSVATPLAVTGSNSSLPMVAAGIALFVAGVVIFQVRALRSR